MARKAVEHVRELFGLSERRACSILNVDRTSVRYVHRRSDDCETRIRLRAIAHERRRFGYRRLGIMLSREGIVMNHKKLLRLYREEGLRVRRRGGRKRAMGTRAPMALPQGVNQRWSLDFVSDALACGRRFRILAVVDDFTPTRRSISPSTARRPVVTRQRMSEAMCSRTGLMVRSNSS